MNRAILAAFLVLTLAAADPLPASIGYATMAPDRTITLHVYARSDDGKVTGTGTLVYRPGDKMYDEVFRHIGGIEPGQSKNVPPWPEKK